MQEPKTKATVCCLSWLCGVAGAVPWVTCSVWFHLGLCSQLKARLGLEAPADSPSGQQLALETGIASLCDAGSHSTAMGLTRVHSKL